VSSTLKRGNGRKDAPAAPTSALRRGSRYPDTAALERKKNGEPPPRTH
jgi:hypothetical protein